jgi:hypothetical protein
VEFDEFHPDRAAAAAAESITLASNVDDQSTWFDATK